MPSKPKQSRGRARASTGTKSKTATSVRRAKTASKASARAHASRVQSPRRKTAKAGKTAKRGKVVLLSGGNPQIAKGDGDAPVKAYIAALSGWKKDITRRIDAIATKSVKNLRKAVKWNSPMYGVDGRDWFMGVHMFTNYVKVAFFRGASLRPVPPGPSKHPETRYVDIREGELDEAQMTKWVKQAAALPGVSMGKSS